MGEGWLLPYTLCIIYAGCILSVEAARIVFLRKVQPGVLKVQQRGTLFHRNAGVMSFRARGNCFSPALAKRSHASVCDEAACL